MTGWQTYKTGRELMALLDGEDRNGYPRSSVMAYLDNVLHGHVEGEVQWWDPEGDDGGYDAMPADLREMFYDPVTGEENTEAGVCFMAEEPWWGHSAVYFNRNEEHDYYRIDWYSSPLDSGVQTWLKLRRLK